MFKIHGKLITVYPREIAINALRDEEEADNILEWLKKEINETWGKRAEIEPSYEGVPKTKVLEILKLLPRTNCRECGQTTCMVFSTLVAAGAKKSDDCPPLIEENKRKLQEYMSQFRLDF
jgi:ArsR family metal-binding transcriptional regulator